MMGEEHRIYYQQNQFKKTYQYISTIYLHKNIFLNFEAYAKQLQSTKDGIQKWLLTGFIESRIDSFACKDLMLIKN